VPVDEQGVQDQVVHDHEPVDIPFLAVIVNHVRNVRETFGRKVHLAGHFFFRFYREKRDDAWIQTIAMALAMGASNVCEQTAGR
jgi:hypothetical protein